jgi:NDP-sugar pyrophosphorylase family protein
MKAMIFSAGLGTRFKPWTDEHPKALALVNGKPLIQRNIEYLQRYGINEVVVNVHHFADQLIKEIEWNIGWGSHIIFSDEKAELLETGGGLLHARHLLENGQPFITLNADILTDFPIDELIKVYQQQQALIAFAVSNRSSSRRFLFDADYRLSGWENQTTGETKIVRAVNQPKSLAYGCVALFDPAIFDLIPQRGKFSLTETYLSLAANELIIGYEANAVKFVDVGKPESVAIAESIFE